MKLSEQQKKDLISILTKYIGSEVSNETQERIEGEIIEYFVGSATYVHNVELSMTPQGIFVDLYDRPTSIIMTVDDGN